MLPSGGEHRRFGRPAQRWASQLNVDPSGGGMNLGDTIRAAWGFAGLDPAEIIEINPFGNVLLRDTCGQFWRICPEELSCDRVASSSEEFQQLRSSSAFQEDWAMRVLVELAHSVLGAPVEGGCYCLKLPAVLGGKYDVENLGVISLSELLSVAGEMARQIRGLPDGTRVKLSVVE